MGLGVIVLSLGFQASAIRTQATITHFPEKFLGMGDDVKPTVEFRTEDGETRSEELIVGLETFDEFISFEGHGLSEGDRIEVEYLPEWPSFVRRAGTSWMGWIIGILFTSIGGFWTMWGLCGE
jgi:hypothetical protein